MFLQVTAFKKTGQEVRIALNAIKYPALCILSALRQTSTTITFKLHFYSRMLVKGECSRFETLLATFNRGKYLTLCESAGKNCEPVEPKFQHEQLTGIYVCMCLVSGKRIGVWILVCNYIVMIRIGRVDYWWMVGGNLHRYLSAHPIAALNIWNYKSLKEGKRVQFKMDATGGSTLTGPFWPVIDCLFGAFALHQMCIIIPVRVGSRWPRA